MKLLLITLISLIWGDSELQAFCKDREERDLHSSTSILLSKLLSTHFRDYRKGNKIQIVLKPNQSQNRWMLEKFSDNAQRAELERCVNKLSKSLFQEAVNQNFVNTLRGISGVDVLRKLFGGLISGVNYIMRWLLSLVRQEGVSLAEFLRGYRVSLTYELVYGIIRWLFFASLAFYYP
ncbi:unnamed protein product [Allacma fusca]|uniref:Uncharacterized protein n=1 Tax=Allacma fusca TaxID=39272 RepID=A0A8J2J742_9HEXA|nr:unnamed protein product [Allacma fusca]